MPSFRYAALDAAGRPSSGTIEAASFDAARAQISRLGFAIERLEPAAGADFGEKNPASPLPRAARAAAENPLIPGSGQAGKSGIEIVAVRHGETDWNAQHRALGQHPDAPGLNETGRAQIAETAKKLAGEKFDLAVVSPAARTRETFEVLKKNLPADLPVIFDPAFFEQSFGELEGKKRDDEPERWKIWKSMTVENDLETQPWQGFERISDLVARLRAGLENLAKKYPGAKILLVSHGAALCGVNFLIGMRGETFLSTASENGEVRRFFWPPRGAPADYPAPQKNPAPAPADFSAVAPPAPTGNFQKPAPATPDFSSPGGPTPADFRPPATPDFAGPGAGPDDILPAGGEARPTLGDFERAAPRGNFFASFFGWLFALLAAIFFTAPLWQSLDTARAALAPVARAAFFVPVGAVLLGIFAIFSVPELARRRGDDFFRGAFLAFLCGFAGFLWVLFHAARADAVAWIRLADAGWWAALVLSGIFVLARIRRG